MKLRPFVSSHVLPPQYYPLQTITISLNSSSSSLSKSKEMSKKVVSIQSKISRRIGAIAAMASIILSKEAFFSEGIANGLDFRMVAPEQSMEEAEERIRGDAKTLLEVKGLIEGESWREAQKLLRKSSSNLKIDIYTIIQNKPGIERPQLRKLYSYLFTNVTKLDYAARDKDASRVWQYYDNIVAVLHDILSRV